MKPKSKYHTMKAHDLSRITRERGLDKPKIITLSEWADYLEADDAKASAKASQPATDDAQDTPAPKTDTDTAKAKGKR